MQKTNKVSTFIINLLNLELYKKKLLPNLMFYFMQTMLSRIQHIYKIFEVLVRRNFVKIVAEMLKAAATNAPSI